MRPESRTPAALDDFVGAYEACQARDGSADLADFLPSREHPLYRRVLRELVRVDLELGWSRGRPRSLDQYRQRFPDLLRDPEAMREIAFEEYRLRRQAGQAPEPAEYRQRYGVDTTGWPAPDAPPGWRPDPAHASAGSFHADPLDSWGESIRAGLPHDLLRDVCRSDPELAFLLAQTMTALPEVGSSFLGFRLLAELGRGAFGRVYLAEQGDLANRLVALKIAADLPGESQTLAQLQHTNIVPVYSTHQAGAFQAVCMPYFGPATLADVLETLRARGGPPASGRDLVDALRERGSRFSPPAGGEATATLRLLERLTYVEAVLWIAARVADGLAHAHEHGIVHQDLKPANILLTAEGQPMLLDFNLSTDTKRSASVAQVGGTIPYMAPEQLAVLAGGDRPVDARSDLYALGVILFELLTGRPPFAVRPGPLVEVVARSSAQKQQPAPRLRRWNRAVPRAVESIVRRLLDPDPARRYASAHDLREDVDRQLDARPLRHAPDRSIRERLGKWLRRHPRLASRSTALILLLVAGAGVLVTLGWQEYAARQADLNQTKAELTQTQEHLGHAREEVLASRKDAEETLRQFQAALAAAHIHRDEAGAIRSAFDSGLFEPEDPGDMARCRAALDRYHVLAGPAWQEAAAVRHLPPAEQEQLRRDVGELLYLLARATLFRMATPGTMGLRGPLRFARPPGTFPLAPLDAVAAVLDANLRHARRLNELAVGCYPEGQRPRALVIQQGVLASLDGREAEAADFFAQAERLKSRSPRDAYLTGVEYAAQGDLKTALSLAEEARRGQPTNAAAWYLEGLAHVGLGDDVRGAHSFDTCLALRPDWSPARYHRGLARLNLRDWPGALEDFDGVLASHPDMGYARLYRARALEEMGRLPDALLDLSRALELLPEARGEVYFRQAILRRKAGDREGAARDEAALLRTEPVNARGWVLRAQARAAASPEDALADYERALELDPRNLPALKGKADLLALRPGGHAAVVEVLDRAVGFYPDSAPLRLKRGLVLARAGLRGRAHADAEAALAGDGGAATLYEAGCIFAQTSRQDPRDRHRALQLLADAVRKGYGGDRLARDGRLTPLRNDPDFEQLLRAVRILAPR